MYNSDLQASDEITELASRILSDLEIKKVEQITNELLGKEVFREPAVAYLQDMFGLSPKRPLYYLHQEIEFLPEKTRYTVENAGSYIDVLVKHCAHEIGNKRLLALCSSLRSNIQSLKKTIPNELSENLLLFNSFFYTPAKHIWEVGDRLHLFNVKETVFALFIAKKLADKIITLSKEAKEYTENK